LQYEINERIEDVAEKVENKRSIFFDRLIVSGKHVDLCLAAVHILDDFSVNAVPITNSVCCSCDIIFIW